MGNKRTRQVRPADKSDPRCVGYESGVLIGNAFQNHTDKTGETIPAISANVGITAEVLRAYVRGHHVPSPQSRLKLERYLGLKEGALAATPVPRRKPSRGVGKTASAKGIVTTKAIEGNFLVVTTRIPLSEIA